MSALPEQHLSLEEYFEIEEASECRHEYIQGVVSVIPAATENHSLITMALGLELGIQLKGKSCRTHSSDFRLKIEAVNLYTYPDLSVICGETQRADGRRDTFVNPTVLIEVLSDSTEAYDRGKKSGFYRTIPSLQEYLLIAQDRPHVECYRRQDTDWLLTEFSSLDEEITLESIGCTLSLAVIYEQLSF